MSETRLWIQFLNLQGKPLLTITATVNVSKPNLNAGLVGFKVLARVMSLCLFGHPMGVLESLFHLNLTSKPIANTNFETQRMDSGYLFFICNNFEQGK